MKQLHSLLQKHIQDNFGGLDSVQGDLKKFITEVNSDYIKSEVEKPSNGNGGSNECIVEEDVNMNQVEYLKGLLYEKNTEIKKLKEEREANPLWNQQKDRCFICGGVHEIWSQCLQSFIAVNSKEA